MAMRVSKGNRTSRDPRGKIDKKRPRIRNNFGGAGGGGRVRETQTNGSGRRSEGWKRNREGKSS